MVYRRFSGQKIIFFAVFGVCSGCATVNVPNLELGATAIQEDENRLMNRAKEASEAIDHSGFVYEDKSVEIYLNEIIGRLLPDKKYSGHIEIYVKAVKDASLNAFSLSNGRIYVNTGIVAAAENEAQIAALLGHEITHVLHRHALKKFRSLMNTTAWWDSIGLITGGLGMAVSELAKVSSVSGYSQDLETEADEFGFQLVQKAGYDVSQTARMFESLNRYLTEEKEKEPFFFSSHPHIIRRIKNFTRLIQEHRQDRFMDSRQVYYRTVMHELVVFNTQLCLKQGMYKTAEHEVNRLTANYPGDARGWLLKGDLYRERQDPQKGCKERDKKADYAQALEAYDHALILDNASSLAMRGKGRMFYMMGNKKEAKVYLQKYLDKEPNAKDKSFIQHLIL